MSLETYFTESCSFQSPFASLTSRAAIAAAAGICIWQLARQKQCQPLKQRAESLGTEWLVEPETVGLSSTDLTHFVAEMSRKYVESGLLAGALVAVVKSGRVVALWELGEYKSTTVFKLYSISKVFTALAALQLVDKGSISVDDAVSRWVPEWSDTVLVQQPGAEARPANQALTLRHCLTHTGGFSNTLPTVHPPSSFRPLEQTRLQKHLAAQLPPPRNLREVVTREAQQSHIFEPGQHFNYSNGGTQLLARVIEEVSGQSIAGYLQDNLFRPLGMENTGFVISEERGKNCVSTDYHPAFTATMLAGMPASFMEKLRLRWKAFRARLCGVPFLRLKAPGVGVLSAKMLWDKSLSFFVPEAGVVSTGLDVVQWLQALTSPARFAHVLPASALAAIGTPETSELCPPFGLDAPVFRGQLFPTSSFRARYRERPFNSFPGQAFGLGACVVQEPIKAGLPARAAGTWHWVGFASTFFFVNPREELAACWLSQLISHRTYPLHHELIKGVHSCLL